MEESQTSQGLVSTSDSLNDKRFIDYIGMQTFSRIWHEDNKAMTPDEVLAMEQDKASRYNERTGSLTDYDCKKCLNRGDFAYAERDKRTGMIYQRHYPCECVRVRDGIRRAKASGLYDSLKRYRFDNFETTEQWQKTILDTAKAYTQSGFGSWFFIGGAVGCGKTHICTAIVRSVLLSGKGAYYEPWLSLSGKLKQTQYNDQDTYYRELGRVQTVDVLYVDDFFKPTQAEKSRPSSADVMIAYEIINYRYANRLPTIISSEWTIDKLGDFDEATASRIYQMAKDYTVCIENGAGKNYRMR